MIEVIVIYVLAGLSWAGLYNRFVDKVDSPFDLLMWSAFWPIVVIPAGVCLILVSFIKITEKKEGGV